MSRHSLALYWTVCSAVLSRLPCWTASAAALQDDVTLLQVSSRQHQKLQEHHREYYWPVKNGDLLRTGYSPFLPSVDVSEEPSWTFTEPDNGVVRASPLIDEERNIYLSSLSGNVYKFAKNGTILWTYKDTVDRTPAVSAVWDGLLYAADVTGQVFALHMANGSKLWQTKIACGCSPDTWSLTATAGVVVAGAVTDSQCDQFYSQNLPGRLWNDRIVALDAKTGKVKWDFNLTQPTFNFLGAVKSGSLVFSDSLGMPFRLNLSTGAVIWKGARAGIQPWHLPVDTTGGSTIGPNNLIYTASNAVPMSDPTTPWREGHLSAFNFETGALVWTKSLEYPAATAAAIGPIGPAGRLGVVVGAGLAPNSPEDSMDIIIQSSYEKKLRIWALDAFTGATLWMHEPAPWHGVGRGDTAVPDHKCLPDAFGNPAIGGDGTTYIGDESGHFYAILDKNGDGHIDPDESEVVAHDMGAAFQGSPGLAPGMLVATPCNGMHVFLAS